MHPRDQTKTAISGLLTVALGCMHFAVVPLEGLGLIWTHIGVLFIGVAWGGYVQKRQIQEAQRNHVKSPFKPLNDKKDS